MHPKFNWGGFYHKNVPVLRLKHRLDFQVSEYCSMKEEYVAHEGKKNKVKKKSNGGVIYNQKP